MSEIPATSIIEKIFLDVSLALILGGIFSICLKLDSIGVFAVGTGSVALGMFGSTLIMQSNRK
jgi:hypothetical protein